MGKVADGESCGPAAVLDEISGASRKQWVVRPAALVAMVAVAFTAALSASTPATKVSNKAPVTPSANAPGYDPSSLVCALLPENSDQEREPSTKTLPQAKLTTVARFPDHYFLENLAVRADGSILVTVLNRKELWYVPSPAKGVPVEPIRMHTFAQLTMGIVEVEPDVFYVCTSNLYTDHESYLQRLDLRGWAPGKPVKPEAVLKFPPPVGALNGCCLIAPNVILVADSWASLIWRVDLRTGGRPSARVWLKHPSMVYHPGEMKPEQPGVNGVRFAAKTNYLYYTATTLRLFMRVRVDPATHDPVGPPEFVAGGTEADDFCLDEDAGVAYVTTHRQNTIDRVSLDPDGNFGPRQIVAGDPFTDELIGPSSAAWGRAQGDYGRLAYVITDGGTASPPPGGIVRPARLLRVVFPEVPKAARP
jgi:hypothetical protein